MTAVSYASFALKKVGAALLTIWVATVVVYFALYLVPGDPLSVLLRGRKPTPETVAMLREQYGLDLPVWQRYLDWLFGLLQGDLGYSIQFQTDVGTVIASRLPTTLWLVGYAAVIILVVGLAAGCWAALTRSRRVDGAILMATSVLSAIPAFVAALILMLVFAGYLGWFPAFGTGTDDPVSRIQHLTLPAIALSVIYVGLITRITRSSLKAQAVSDHVHVAKLRGTSGFYLFRHHILRNALNPILAYAGVLIAGLLVTSQLVEYAFDVNGIGGLLVESVRNIDFAVVQIVVIIIVTAFIAVNLIVDVLAPVINPDLRQVNTR